MNRKKGYLLPLVLILILISLIIGFTTLYLSELGRTETIRRLYREKAFYIAEGGAQRAYAHLKKDISWVPESSSQSLGGGTFYVIKDSTSSETIIITSTGTFNNVEEKVELTIKKSGGGIFSKGVFGSSQVYLSGSSQIWGYDSRTGATSENADVGSNTLVNVNWNATLYGNVAVPPNGSITFPEQKPNAITGQKKKDAETRTLPPVTIPSDLQNLSYTQYGGTGLSGNYQLSNGNYTINDWPYAATISSGNYHFRSIQLGKGNPQLNLSGKIRMYIEETLSSSFGGDIVLSAGTTVEIYMGRTNGKITFDSDSQINYNNSPANLAIYVASSKAVDLLSNVRINAAIYAPNSVCNITGSSELRGGIVANQLNLTGNVRLYDDIALRQVSVPGDTSGGTGGIQIVKWRKPNWKQ